MLRHLFLAGYGGDPTAGYDFTPSTPFDCSELVQPSVGDLYPPAPAQTVLVWTYCQEHDALTVAPEPDAVPDPLLPSRVAVLEAKMASALDTLKAEYTYVGVIYYA
jgi:hypothetical protein